MGRGPNEPRHTQPDAHRWRYRGIHFESPAVGFAAPRRLCVGNAWSRPACANLNRPARQHRARAMCRASQSVHAAVAHLRRFGGVTLGGRGAVSAHGRCRLGQRRGCGAADTFRGKDWGKPDVSPVHKRRRILAAVFSGAATAGRSAPSSRAPSSHLKRRCAGYARHSPASRKQRASMPLNCACGLLRRCCALPDSRAPLCRLHCRPHIRCDQRQPRRPQM